MVQNKTRFYFVTFYLVLGSLLVFNCSLVGGPLIGITSRPPFSGFVNSELSINIIIVS